jgi:membrane-bound metal-dependent hydrolase YbcI (DUF457 family)
MLVGHFAVALAAKRVDPKISLGTLTAAAMLPDLLWPPLMLAGLEHVKFRPGVMGAAQYLDMVDVEISHSLVMDVVWAGLFAAIWYWRRRDARAAWIIAAAVISHWILDVVSHPPDMPLAPGIQLFLGLGLWTSIPATIVVEGGLWLVAIVAYVQTTRAENRSGIYAFWIGIVLLTLLWYNNIAGPPPPNPDRAPIGSLVVFSLAVGWAYWMNRSRSSRAISRSNHF